MATINLRGDAIAVAQITHVTPANVEIGDIFRLTINGRTISYTAAAATVADVVAGLMAAWNASSFTECGEATASNGTTHLVLTADTAGKPFVVTSSTVDGGGTNDQTLVVSSSVASAGPNHWDTASNWSTGTVPANGDDVILENSSVELLYGLNQSAVTLASLKISKSYTGRIGLPVLNPLGYVEYRDTYLRISATTILVGNGVGSGSGRIKLDTGTNACSLGVSHTAAGESGQPALYWKGAHASNQVTVIKGSVAIAHFAGETATLPTLLVGQADSPATDAIVLVGAGVTLTTVTQTNGVLTSQSNIPTLNQHGGECGLIGAAAVTAANIYAGATRSYSTGTITTLTIAGGTMDFSRDLRPRTVTNCVLHGGSTLNDPGKTVTWTNGIKLNQTKPTAIVLDIGTHLTLTPSAY